MMSSAQRRICVLYARISKPHLSFGGLRGTYRNASVKKANIDSKLGSIVDDIRHSKDS